MNRGLVPPPTIGEPAAGNDARATAGWDIGKTPRTGNGASSVPWIFRVIRRSTVWGIPCRVLAGEL